MKLSFLKQSALTLSIALAIGLCPPALPGIGGGGAAIAQVRVDISIFFDELAPHGRWLRTPRYGYVFVPRGISDNWRPYSEGHWVYTDEYGWMWISDEPFGWATYHYGRWAYDTDYGWYWVPGRDWAPAWVDWRYSDDYIGWAPLPPLGSGYAGLSISTLGIGIGAWRFVSTRDFLAPKLTIITADRNPELVRLGRKAGPIRIVGGRPINKGVAVHNVERVTGRKVDVLKIADRADRKPGPPTVREVQVEVFRPKLAAPIAGLAPKEAFEARTITNRTKDFGPKDKAKGRNLVERAAPVKPVEIKKRAPAVGAQPDAKAAPKVAPTKPAIVKPAAQLKRPPPGTKQPVPKAKIQTPAKAIPKKSAPVARPAPVKKPAVVKQQPLRKAAPQRIKPAPTAVPQQPRPSHKVTRPPVKPPVVRVPPAGRAPSSPPKASATPKAQQKQQPKAQEVK